MHLITIEDWTIKAEGCPKESFVWQYLTDYPILEFMNIYSEIKKEQDIEKNVYCGWYNIINTQEIEISIEEAEESIKTLLIDKKIAFRALFKGEIKLNDKENIN